MECLFTLVILHGCTLLETFFCICRAASIQICGQEHMHVELCMRTVCELVGHEDYYLRPEVMSFCGGFVDNDKKHARLHATSASWEKATLKTVPPTSNLARETFVQDCLETTSQGTFCNMWHIHALSSVIKHPINSIYPEHNQYIRPLLHKVVIPREISNDESKTPIHIMWTRASPMTRSGPWSPNHFAPCIPATRLQSHSETKGTKQRPVLSTPHNQSPPTSSNGHKSSAVSTNSPSVTYASKCATKMPTQSSSQMKSLRLPSASNGKSQSTKLNPSVSQQRTPSHARHHLPSLRVHNSETIGSIDKQANLPSVCSLFERLEKKNSYCTSVFQRQTI